MQPSFWKRVGSGNFTVAGGVKIRQTLLVCAIVTGLLICRRCLTKTPNLVFLRKYFETVDVLFSSFGTRGRDELRDPGLS